jgi:hypothetical protein
MFLNRGHSTFTTLRRKFAPCSAHHSPFSQIGASGKPRTLHSTLWEPCAER